MAARDRTILSPDGLAALTAELRSVNETLWDIEDDVRVCEPTATSGRSSSSWRGRLPTRTTITGPLKRKINELLGSAIVEEKAYAVRC